MTRAPRPPRFDARWNRRRKARRWWSGLWRSGRWILLLAAFVLAKHAFDRWIAPPPAEWTQVTTRFTLCGERGGGGCALDGDTLAIGFGPSARRIRLAGYDAPEREGACPAESARAAESTRALVAWLQRGPFEWDGGAGPPRDRYGRELRSVRRVQPDRSVDTLADHMIDAGLAEGSGWGAASIDWCAR